MVHLSSSWLAVRRLVVSDPEQRAPRLLDAFPMDGPPARLQVDAMHARLRAELAALVQPRVRDVMQAFLDVAGLASAKGLWSLEFAFDEDDSRVARLEARFGNGRLAERVGASLRGFEVRILLPKELPKYSHDAHAFEAPVTLPPDPASLVARFIRSLEQLGAYRFIEPLLAEGVETALL
jgi:hypothetical protein